MSSFICKMCGGTIEYNPGDSVGICGSCGTKQTLLRPDDVSEQAARQSADDIKRQEEEAATAALLAGINHNVITTEDILKDDLAEAMQTKRELEILADRFDSIKAGLAKDQASLETTQKQIDAFEAERAALGLFDLDKKQEITRTLQQREQEKIKLTTEIEQYTDQLQGFTHVDQINGKLVKENEKIKDLEEKLLHEQQDKITFTFDEALAYYGKHPLAFLTKAIDQGEKVYFGSYYQHDENRKEPIAWRVLETKGHHVLLLSEYALDCKQYHTERTNITWNECTLRAWLNHDFLEEAFTLEERSVIARTTEKADANPDYTTNPGSDTHDKVFLLSISEVKHYFHSDIARQCKGTPYCFARGAYQSDGKVWWWLRSPGDESDDVTGVFFDGTVNYSGGGVNNVTGAVRPALWVNLEA